MSNEIYELQNITLTENGGKAYRSTGSACLNLFAAVGAMRNADECRIQELFIRAFAENPDCALRIMFFARDIHGGLGERRIFRTIVHYLAYIRPESIIKNIPLFSEYGRFDDLLSLFETPCEKQACAYIKTQLAADEADMRMEKNISLLAKWLPSVNTSSATSRKSAKRLCRYLKMTESEYRIILYGLFRLRCNLITDILNGRIRTGSVCCVDLTVMDTRKSDITEVFFLEISATSNRSNIRKIYNRVTKNVLTKLD